MKKELEGYISTEYGNWDMKWGKEGSEYNQEVIRIGRIYRKKHPDYKSQKVRITIEEII